MLCLYGLMGVSFKLIWWIYDEECRKHDEEQIRMNRK
jgi:hypothetical protein